MVRTNGPWDRVRTGVEGVARVPEGEDGEDTPDDDAGVNEPQPTSRNIRGMIFNIRIGYKT